MDNMTTIKWHMVACPATTPSATSNLRVPKTAESLCSLADTTYIARGQWGRRSSQSRFGAMRQWCTQMQQRRTDHRSVGCVLHRLL